MNENQVISTTYKNAIEKHSDYALQFEKERQSVILQSIGDAVIATDIDGNVILMNPVAEKLTGWKLTAAVHKPLTEVFHIVNKLTREESVNPVKTVLNTGKVLKLELDTVLISHNEKKEYSINDSCAPIIDLKGNIIGVVLVFRDVTKQKQEEALKEKIIADLIQQNKDHTDFDNIVSHDLRAPLSNIIGLTKLLNDKNLKESDKEFMMLALNKSAARLDEVITDLNSILSLEKQFDEKKEYVHFSQIISNIQESLENIVEKQHNCFKIDFSIVDEIFTIKSYIYSIFYNLISNSIKYRRPNVPLEIKIKSSFVDGKIIITFKDNGLGINLNKNGNEIFGLYKRFHTEKAQGKGIGLYMVKVQVEKLGGKISLKSKVNQGTEFTIALT